MRVLRRADRSAPTHDRKCECLLAEFERSGDSRAFEELVRRHSPAVFATCKQLTRNAHDAEDATQAVFLTFAVRARTTNGIANVGAWLQQVARNTSLNMCRSRKRRVVREQREGMEGATRVDPPHPVQDASAQEVRAIIRAEIGQLPTKYRLPLILHYFGGLATEELAREVNCTPKTLAVRLFRGRQMLRDRLRDRGLAISGGAIVALAVADAILGTLARSIERPVLARAAVPTAADAGVRAVRLARLCAGAVVAARSKIAVVALLFVGTALAQSIRDNVIRLPDVRSPSQLIEGVIDRLRDALQDLRPQMKLPVRVSKADPVTPVPSTTPLAPTDAPHLVAAPTVARSTSLEAPVTPGWPGTMECYAVSASGSKDWQSAAIAAREAEPFVPPPASDSRMTLTGSAGPGSPAVAWSGGGDDLPLSTPDSTSPHAVRDKAVVAAATKAAGVGHTFSLADGTTPVAGQTFAVPGGDEASPIVISGPDAPPIDVTVTPPTGVPEPASIGLVAVAGVALLGRRRRRRR